MTHIIRDVDSGDGDVCARVYDPVRPELFFESVARVVGNGDPVGVRADSSSNTPNREHRRPDDVARLNSDDMSVTTARA